jgi:hypothetical protein
MRTTSVLSFFVASIAVLSPVYAAPVSTEAGLAVAKRCYGEGCKSVVVTPATSDNSDNSSTAQLVQMLIDTLSSYQNGVSTPNTPSTTLDAVNPVTGPSSSHQAGPSLEDLVSGAL